MLFSRISNLGLVCIILLFKNHPLHQLFGNPKDEGILLLQSSKRYEFPFSSVSNNQIAT